MHGDIGSAAYLVVASFVEAVMPFGCDWVHGECKAQLAEFLLPFILQLAKLVQLSDLVYPLSKLCVIMYLHSPSVTHWHQDTLQSAV